MTDPDGAEFDECIDALAAIAHRVAYRVLGSRADAEEVAQDVLARAFVRWRRIHGHAEAWVARVAANEAISVWRRRRPTVGLDDVDRLVVGSGRGDGGGDVANVLLRIGLVEAVRLLPKRQREVVVLRHLAGCSEREVAEALGLTVGSVKQHAHRGLVRLRADLPAIDEEEPDVRIAR